MDNRRTMGSESKYISLDTIAGSDAVARTIAESTDTKQRGKDENGKLHFIDLDM